MKKISILLLLLIASLNIMQGSISAHVCGVQEGNLPYVAQMTKADFIVKVMDYEKNPTQWVYKGNKPCIIDFYADWCGPCKIASPILEDLAKEYAGKIDVYKINVDKERELSSVFGITNIPAILYCPMKGKPVMASGIGKDVAQTKQMFKENIENILLKE